MIILSSAKKSIETEPLANEESRAIEIWIDKIEVVSGELECVSKVKAGVSTLHSNNSVALQLQPCFWLNSPTCTFKLTKSTN